MLVLKDKEGSLGLRIISPQGVPGSARIAGVQSSAEHARELYPGDVIVAVDGRDVTQASHDDVIGLLAVCSKRVNVTVRTPERRRSSSVAASHDESPLPASPLSGSLEPGPDAGTSDRARLVFELLQTQQATLIQDDSGSGEEGGQPATSPSKSRAGMRSKGSHKRSSKPAKSKKSSYRASSHHQNTPLPKMVSATPSTVPLAPLEAQEEIQLASKLRALATENATLIDDDSSGNEDDRSAPC